LFTDGVTEARNQAEELLGEEELKTLLITFRHRPVEEIVEKIFRRIADYSAGTPQADDISVLILRFGISTDEAAETFY
jgi:sigma-B regulation protein RsbU (phosphoserine phosphatase)